MRFFRKKKQPRWYPCPRCEQGKIAQLTEGGTLYGCNNDTCRWMFTAESISGLRMRLRFEAVLRADDSKFRGDYR